VTIAIRDDGAGGTLIPIKAVPGASRDEVVGPLGDRLKVRVSAPPEGGKANRAICGLVARELGVAKRDVEVVEGATRAEKVVRVAGVSAASAAQRLNA